MTKNRVVIQPGPIFYEVFAGLLRAQGRKISHWAEEHDLTPTNLRVLAVGGANGPRSVKVRELMIEEIGEPIFREFYEARLRNEGYLS